MNLGDRMKGYEKAYDIKFPRRLPLIIRIDGKSFHQVLKKADKPFDFSFKNAMDYVAEDLLKEVSGAVFIYIQSDEINLLINNYLSLEFEPYFNNELQKIVSVTASMATRQFNLVANKKITPACFDSRAFILPREEVCNYFIWRQRDWTRNSIQMVARSLYSHKACDHKKGGELQEMIFKKGINWNDLQVWQRRGRAAYKENYDKSGVIRTKIKIDDEIPIFSQERKFIERYI